MGETTKMAYCFRVAVAGTGFEHGFDLARRRCGGRRLFQLMRQFLKLSIRFSISSS
jgi:hypothetical protein